MSDGNATTRVLMVCPELPTADSPGSMAPTARQIQSLAGLGIKIDVVDMHGIPKLKYLQAVPRIRRLGARADLIHAHFGYCGWLAQVVRKRPKVVSFMGDDLLGSPLNSAGDLEWFSRQMVRANVRLARLAEAVIVKSPEMANVIANVQSTVIPNGVDIQTFRPIDRLTARTELGLNVDRKLVLFPGNPQNPRKGHALAVAAVEIASRKLGQQIDLIPLWGIEPDRVATLMNACDVMLMTSLIEGSPNVVKEAMACNVPVIGVPVGDVHQLLEGVDGYAACQRDPAQIGSCLADMLASPVSPKGRQTLIDRGLDLESVARRVVKVYEHVLGRKIQLGIPAVDSLSAEPRV